MGLSYEGEIKRKKKEKKWRKEGNFDADKKGETAATKLRNTHVIVIYFYSYQM